MTKLLQLSDFKKASFNFRNRNHRQFLNFSSFFRFFILKMDLAKFKVYPIRTSISLGKYSTTSTSSICCTFIVIFTFGQTLSNATAKRYISGYYFITLRFSFH